LNSPVIFEGIDCEWNDSFVFYWGVIAYCLGILLFPVAKFTLVGGEIGSTIFAWEYLIESICYSFYFILLPLGLLINDFYPFNLLTSDPTS
jgi:hypothetical protein